MMALGEGPIAGIGAVWKGKDKTTLANLGLTLYNGTPNQTVWPFLSGYNTPTNWVNESKYGYFDWYQYSLNPSGYTPPSFTNQALNYSSTAYLASSAYDLGSDASVPNHGFEVIGSNVYGGGIVDANPADVVQDMLANNQYGVGLSPTMIGSTLQYSKYCVALGLFMSPAYTEQRSAADCLKEITDLTNTAIVWSGGLIKFVPYGDSPITGNGQTYTPDLTPLFDIGDDDYVKDGDEDPLRIRRSSPADAKNRISLEFRNRTNQYNDEVVSVEDQDAIERFGLKPTENVTAKMFCVSSAAKMSAQLLLQKLLFNRNTYSFTLGARYAMLEPMDIITLTDSSLGMDRVAVRITEIQEIDDGFEITAEDLNIGVANAAQYAHDNGLRWQMTINASPQQPNAPLIFEMPADANTTGLAIGVAVGGQLDDPIYGGSRVWVSFDGTNYRAVATIYGSSRYGTLTSAYPAATGVDNTNFLRVNLASGGQLISGSASDAVNGATLMVINNEYVAHQTATLTGANAYNLRPVNRGMYGSTPAAQASGSRFARIDQAIAQLNDLDLGLIGKQIWIKCTAFNAYGSGELDLSLATAYTYTITGWAKNLKTPVNWSEITGVGKPENGATVGAPQGTGVGGVPVEIGYGLTPTGMFEDWNRHGTIAAAQRAWIFTNPAAVSFFDGDLSGGRGLSVNGGCTLLGNHRISYAAEDLYRVKARVFVSSLGQTHYVGVTAFDAGGNQLTVTDGGSFHYFAGANSPSSTGWYEWEGYFRGRAAVGTGAAVGIFAPNPSAPNPVRTGAVTVAPAFVANDGPPGGFIVIDYIAIEKVEDLTALPSRPWAAGDFQKRGQVVTHLDRSWIARIDNTGVTPPSTSTGNATWALLGTNGAPAGTFVSGLPAASVADAINADGTIRPGKVTAQSLSANVVNEIVSASQSNVTATAGGALLLSLAGVSARPSQGGYVQCILTCNLRMPTGTSGGSQLYGWLQRSPAGANSWTQLHSWLMGKLTQPFYQKFENPGYVNAPVSNLTLNTGVSAQYIDVPPSDGDWDYRWLVSTAPAPFQSVPGDLQAATAENAYGIAFSVKVGV
jgi:hypothetical protein